MLACYVELLLQNLYVKQLPQIKNCWCPILLQVVAINKNTMEAVTKMMDLKVAPKGSKIIIGFFIIKQYFYLNFYYTYNLYQHRQCGHQNTC